MLARCRARRGEVDFLVQIGEREVYPDRLQIERVFQAVGGSEQPAADTLAGVQPGPHAFEETSRYSVTDSTER